MTSTPSLPSPSLFSLSTLRPYNMVSTPSIQYQQHKAHVKLTRADLVLAYLLSSSAKQGQTLSEPVVEKHSANDASDRFAYAYSEMQGWRICKCSSSPFCLGPDGREVRLGGGGVVCGPSSLEVGRLFGRASLVPGGSGPSERAWTGCARLDWRVCGGWEGSGGW